MTFCTSCGAEIAADKKFCVQCGAPVEPVTVPATLEIPAAPVDPLSPSSTPGTSLVQPKRPSTFLIIGSIVIVLVIFAVAYSVGLPMLRANQNTPGGFVPSPTSSVIVTLEPTAKPIPPVTTAMPETTTPSGMVRDLRLEEDYEQIYTLHQNFSFGQKVNFIHDLTRPPLYVRFNLTPTLITRHRLVSIGTRNEHFENTTETSPYSWFEIKVLDAGSGVVVNEQGYGNDYSDITRQNFMVRQQGNYRIEMSGNEVNAEVQMLIGTP